MRVAVVVLTWNGREDTLACLRSLQHARWDDLDVVVVDNGSADGTEEAVKAAFPEVVTIQNHANLGFAGGNNVGIDRALDRGAEAVLVLNNDTVVSPDAISALVAAMEADPLVGACSPVLPYAGDPARLWFAGSSYDPTRARAGRASAYETSAALPTAPVRITRAVGAAMLVRRSVIERVGAFAEELFYLYEDVEWSLRMRAAGWHILLVPAASIAHRVAASQGGDPVTPTTAYYGTRNDLEVGRRYGAGRLRQAGCVGVHVAQVRRAPRGIRAATLRATAAGAIDFCRGRLGPRRET